MLNELQADCQRRMEKNVLALRSELGRLRTGRAHSSLIEGVHVEYYGNPTPINQVASIVASDARTLTVTPWERTLIPAIEKAIMQANLGLTPMSAGETIRIVLPQLTQERRKEMIRLVRNECENARVSLRNTRRDVLNQVKEELNSKQITEDDERRAQDVIQKITDKFIVQVDEILAQKEKELTDF